MFPLNGANKASVWLEVEQEYSFTAVYDQKNPKVQSILITLDTPNSSPARTTSVQVVLSAEEHHIFTSVNLVSPTHKAGIEAGLKNNDKELALYVKANSGADEWLGKLGFEKAPKGGSQEYTPILLYNTPKTKGGDNVGGFKVTGKVVVDGGRYTFKNVELVGPAPLPFSVNGWIAVQGTKFSSDLKLAMEGKQGTVVGSIEYGERLLKTDIAVTTPFHEYANGKVIIDYSNADDHVSYSREIKKAYLNFFYVF